MAERSAVASVETFIVSLPRAVPYLGPLGPGEEINAKGYFVRRGNRTIYPSTDMSVIVKITARDGTVGWGETYGIVAPGAVTAIIDDVLGPMVVVCCGLAAPLCARAAAHLRAAVRIDRRGARAAPWNPRRRSAGR